MADQSVSSSSPKPEFINLNVHKAGLEGLNQERINQIIQEASKGSNFYTFQQKRQKRIESQIKQLKSKAALISDSEQSNSVKRADMILKELEKHRILNRIIVHFDMDMFFAAVEIKKNPSLAKIPMAVGSLAMISTSNYIARKYGVRSAMAGFIAKKLCPKLTLIKPNFKSYSEESEVVMNIIRDYDPNLRSWSLDEVYIDLTDYVFDKYSSQNNVPLEELYNLQELNEDIWQCAFEIVDKIRSRIAEETKLTVSAGISCNTKISKVCTDINKPNGQFMVKGNREEIMDFVSKIEVRKFVGIGPVTGQILSAFDIIRGSDIYLKRGLLVSLFSELNVYSYLKIYLGIGTSFLHDEEPDQQKSHSRERTVSELNDFDGICQLLKDISVRLSQDLKSESQLCKTVTLKLKRTSFEVFIKSRTIDKYTDDNEVLFNVAKELLSQEITKFPNQKYRLIGLRASNLRNKYEEDSVRQQLILQKFLITAGEQKSKMRNLDTFFNYECPLCDRKFDDNYSYEMHQSFCDGDFSIDTTSLDNEKEDIRSASSEDSNQIPQTESIKEIPKPETTTRIVTDSWQYLQCPICQSNTLFKNNDELNHHIDICLNRDLCIQLTAISSDDNGISGDDKSESSFNSIKNTSSSLVEQTITPTFNRNKKNIKRDCQSSPSPSSSIEKDYISVSSKRKRSKCNKAYTSNSISANQTRIDHYFH